MGVSSSKKPEETEQSPNTVKWRLEDHVQKREPAKPEDYGYLAVPDLDLEWPQDESQKDKIWRKCKENPFVPIGQC